MSSSLENEFISSLTELAESGDPKALTALEKAVYLLESRGLMRGTRPPNEPMPVPKTKKTRGKRKNRSFRVNGVTFVAHTEGDTTTLSAVDPKTLQPYRTLLVGVDRVAEAAKLLSRSIKIELQVSKLALNPNGLDGKGKKSK